MILMNKLMNKLKRIIAKNKILLSFLLYLRFIVVRYYIKKYFKSYYLLPATGKIEVLSDDKISFFGYYNISPENSKKEIIFLSVNNEKKRGSINEPAKIKYKASTGEVYQIASTKAWNWQQGCMLQWLPNDDNYIIFNDYDAIADKYISKVIDIEGKVIKKYNLPIYSICKSGEYALSLNFERLAKLRPDYGYFNKKNNSILSDDHDGIWYLNLTNSKIKLIITIEQLKQLSSSITMEKAIHKVNHIDINPSGKRFIFLHRWLYGGTKYTRLISSNLDGSELFILNGDKMTSHCCWEDDAHILSYCYIENKGNGYYRFKDLTNEVSLISKNLAKVDGHPSISKDKRWLLSDTYPDKSKYSSAYLFNLKNEQLFNLGVFHQPLRYKGEKRIDLHPKWSHDNKRIFIESGHLNNRRLFQINLNIQD